MSLKPSDEREIKQKIREEESFELEFDEEKLVEQLQQMVQLMTGTCSWISNIKITNKAEERKRFKQKRERNERYTPELNFADFPHDENQLRQILERCKQAAERLEQHHLDSYGAEVITADQLTEFFQEIFRELELYVELAASIEDEDAWRNYSEKIWPLPSEEEAEKARKEMKEVENEIPEKDLDSEDLRQMFEDEVERLGMEYDVEVRQVPGCYNIPEEKKVIVADGDDRKRYYSIEEARMLTMHEIFHAVRAYNGYNAGKNDLPPILAVHTPFYDQTEEGGALYREKRTGTDYPEKEFDYLLRYLIVHELSQTDSFSDEFEDVMDKLVELGAEEERVFDLILRNREVMRHHVYKAGYEEWEDLDEKQLDGLLLGKVNLEYAELFQKEVEAGGMITPPEVTASQLFDFTFKDSE